MLSSRIEDPTRPTIVAETLDRLRGRENRPDFYPVVGGILVECATGHVFLTNAEVFGESLVREP